MVWLKYEPTSLCSSGQPIKAITGSGGVRSSLGTAFMLMLMLVLLVYQVLQLLQACQAADQ